MRLFVGIVPSADAVVHLDDALAAVRDRAGLRRWQPVERWHVTLAFLGEVLPQRVDRLRAALSAVCATAPTMPLRLAGSGSFHTGRGAGALWIGVEGGCLAELAARVGTAVASEVEARPFRAHLTLARWRPPERPDHRVLATLRSYRGPHWEVEEVMLMQSRLGRSPLYERIDGWTLAEH